MSERGASAVRAGLDDSPQSGCATAPELPCPLGTCPGDCPPDLPETDVLASTQGHATRTLVCPSPAETRSAAEAGDRVAGDITGARRPAAASRALHPARHARRVRDLRNESPRRRRGHLGGRGAGRLGGRRSWPGQPGRVRNPRGRARASVRSAVPGGRVSPPRLHRTVPVEARDGRLRLRPRDLRHA